MWRVAWKGLLAHKVRVVLTTLAVVLGVAFVAGTFILTDSMDRAFSGLFAEINEGTDVYVRGSTAFRPDTDSQGGFVNQRPTLPATIVADVEAVDGVAGAGGWVESYAQFVAKDGEPIAPQAPTLGLSWSDDGGPLRLTDGAPPRGPGEVVMDRGTASLHGFALADEVRVVTVTGVETFRIVGLSAFGQSDNLLGATLASFELDTARRLFDKPDAFDQIAVRAEEGVSAAALRDRIGAALGGRAEVVTAADSSAEDLASIRQALGFIGTALLAFAAVALFVGAFIIANTFSIVVAQRSREFALLRAVGASSRQVRRSVLAEALVVGVLASGIGLVAGIGFAAALKGLMSAFGLSLPPGPNVVLARTVVAAFAVGIVVTVVSAIVPARRASQVAPVEAMRTTGPAAEAPSRRRTSLGSAAVVVGVALLAIGLLVRPANALLLVGMGALATLLGVALLSPLVAGPMARVLGTAGARLGVPGKLARENAGRSPRRTASTASALMIGLALVSFLTILAASITAAVADVIDRQLRADFILMTDAPGFRNLPPALAEELRGAPEIGVVSPLRWGQWQVEGQSRGVVGVDPQTVEAVADLGVTQGSVVGMTPSQVLVEQAVAEELGYALGDLVEVTFAATGEQELEVVGLYTQTELLGGSFLISIDLFGASFAEQMDAIVALNAAAGVEPEAARAAVERVAADFPGLQVRDQAEFRADQEGQINQILGLMMALLAFAVIIALLGITNTLALSVFERTRELGLLRAVGMTRRQVRSMVRWESVIVSSFGALLGVVVGSFFGWAVVASMREEGLERMVLPGGQLAVYVLVAAAAGVVAALFPARRAARLDVLEAIATE